MASAPVTTAAATSAEDGAILSCCVSGSIWDEGEPTGRVEKIGGVECYVAASSNPQSTTYIVLLSDIFGIKLPNIRLVADRFASKGFNVVVPDILNGDALDPEHIEPVMELTQGILHAATKTMRAISLLPSLVAFTMRHGDASTLPIIRAVAADLRAAPRSATKLGAVGYCFGGRPAIVLSATAEAAATAPVFDAFAVAHPSGLKIPTEFDAVSVPGLVCLAEDDMGLPPARAAQLKKLFTDPGQRPGKPAVQVKEYAGTRHGYAVRAKLSDEVARKARDQTLEDMAEFFTKALVVS
ncbi:hypothetical protein HK405_008229 [Cladochytrium tenue]|nr:hypothetical protein HK405_008229 [Cladochytrium tenue]